MSLLQFLTDFVLLAISLLLAFICYFIYESRRHVDGKVPNKNQRGALPKTLEDTPQSSSSAERSSGREGGDELSGLLDTSSPNSSDRRKNESNFSTLRGIDRGTFPNGTDDIDYAAAALPLLSTLRGIDRGNFPNGTNDTDDAEMTLPFIGYTYKRFQDYSGTVEPLERLRRAPSSERVTDNEWAQASEIPDQTWEPGDSYTVTVPTAPPRDVCCYLQTLI